MARVSIQNTGTAPLTNVEINYGDGHQRLFGDTQARATSYSFTTTK